jgi:prepilin-type N-terminal cleavage/methylation domain-containing protein
MFRKLSKKGFSLVELLVVITIMAILSIVAYTAVAGQTIKAKNARRLQDISTIQSALELYIVKNGDYPGALTDLTTDYISKVPKDPKTTNNYAYWRGDNAENSGTQTSSKTYILATTLEEEDASTPMKNNIATNNNNFSVPGKKKDSSGCLLTQATVETDNCYPYLP